MTLRDPLLTGAGYPRGFRLATAGPLTRHKMPAMTRCARPLATLLLGSALLVGCAVREERRDVMVFAAASLQDVMLELAAAYAPQQGTAPAFNFAGSNTLAQQIIAAPRSQIFVSADQDWVDALGERDLLVEGRSRPLFGNRLVLIAGRRESPWAPAGCPKDVVSLSGARLALADPEAVPAGRYARSALEAIVDRDSNLWQRVAPRVVPTLDTRGALALVASTPDLLGIVYRTDATSSSRVEVLCEIETSLDRPIVYWGAAVSDGGTPAARNSGYAFLDFLASPEARLIIERHGFIPLN